MKKLLAMLGLCLVALSGFALANNLVCDGTIYPDPGEEVVLNGTWIPEDEDITDIWYGWTFSNGTDDNYNIYNESGLIEQPLDNAYLNFSAPLTPGCYKAYLTVYANKTYTTESLIELALPAPCVNMTCYEICVNEYKCSNCSDIFCDYNCSDFPTDTTTYCPDWNDTEGALCYLGEEGSSVVKWYIVTDDVYNDMGNDPYNLTDQTPDEEDYCFDPDWCSYDQGVYKIIMSVWGDPETEEDGEELFFACLSGTVVQVESPEAEISTA